MPAESAVPPVTFEHSVARTLADMISDRVRGWVMSTPEPGLWRFEDTDPDYEGRHVLVDGRQRELRVLPPMEGKHLGPSLIGFVSGVTVRVDLPGMTDRFDLRSALGALVKIGALPAGSENTNG